MTIQKQVNELTSLNSFADSNVIPVHDGNGLKKGTVTQLATNLASKFSNPNLLLNPNFAINQRGKTTYSDTGYSVDRWKVYNCSFNVSNKVLTGTGTTIGTLTQILENSVSGTYTISIKLSAVSGTLAIWFVDTSGTAISKHEVTSAGTYSWTYTGNILAVSIRTLNSATSATLEWIKLEKGAIPTLYIEPNFADELEKCQRYFSKLGTVLSGYCTNNAIYIPFSTGKIMRDAKTVIISGTNKETYLILDGSKKQVSFNTTNPHATVQFVRLYLNTTDSAINNKAFGIDINDLSIYVDSEIY